MISILRRASVITLLITIVFSKVSSQPIVDTQTAQLPALQDSAKVKALLEISEAYFVSFNRDSLIKYARLASAEAHQLGREKNVVDALIYEGMAHSKAFEFDESFVLYEKAKDIAERINYVGGLASIYGKLGFNHDRLGDDEAAISNFLKSLTYYEKINDYNNIGKAYMNVVSVFGQHERRDKVIEYIGKTNSIIEKIEDPYIQAFIYYGSAAQYCELGVLENQFLDSAEVKAWKGIEIAKKNNFNERVAEFYNVFSTIHMLRKEYAKCIVYCDSALHYSSYTSPALKIQINLRLSDSYFGLDNYKSAFAFLDSAHNINKTINSSFYATVIAESEYEKHRELGNTAKALKALETLRDYENSLFNEEKANAINELETKYETEKKTNEIEVLNNQAKLQEVKIQQKNLLITGAVIVFVILTTVILLFYRQRSLRRQNEMLSLQQRFLRSQMNPHFIFNALGAIQKYVVKKDPMGGASFISKFAMLMRQFLEHSRQNYITLEEEVSTISNYLTVQQLRFENAFEYSIHVDENIDVEQTEIPPLLAQPFIENALEHGIALRESKGKVEVIFSRSGKNLLLRIRDNGIGLSNAGYLTHKSLATKITQDRLKTLSKTTDSFELSIENIKDELGNIAGVEVCLVVPVKPQS